MVTGAVAVLLKSLRFKALCDTATDMDKHVAHYQAYNLFIHSLDTIKKQGKDDKIYLHFHTWHPKIVKGFFC